MAKSIIERILITGGAGFIGSHLVESYLRGGSSVTVVDNLKTGTLDNLVAVQNQIEFIHGELLTLLNDNVIEVANYDLVFHLAGNGYVPPSVEQPAYDFQANLQTTLVLLEHLRHSSSPPRLVFASTAAVYGSPDKMPIAEEDSLNPISPYGVSKLAGERYVAVYSSLYNIRATSLRFFSVFGPKLRKQVIYDLFTKLETNPQYLEVLGNGMQERDFVYVSDLVDALHLIAESAPMYGEVYNVASGSSVTIRELVAMVCEAAGITPEIRYTGVLRPGDAERWVVNIDRLKKLGYKSTVGLAEGLQQTFAWYKSQQYKKILT